MANNSPKSVQRKPDKRAIDNIGKENPKKSWNRDCGLLAMDYGSGIRGCIWRINGGTIFFFA